MKTLGFIGKANITSDEETLLKTLGRIIARTPRELIVVPAPGATTAVRMGVEAEGGKVQSIASGVLTVSAHSLVYADERLLTRLRQVDPTFGEKGNVFLMSSPLELEKFLRTMRVILGQWGIPYPE